MKDPGTILNQRRFLLEYDYQYHLLLQERKMEKKLYRSEHNRVFLGVCGGLGDYFTIDPVIIRVITVLIIIATGFFPGIVAYLIIALIIPTESSTTVTPGDSFKENINDMRNTTSSLGEDIRTAFQGKETKTGERYPITPPSQTRQTTNTAIYILGIIIIAIGIFFILNNFFGWLWSYLWPALLILAGILIIVAVARQK